MRRLGQDPQDVADGPRVPAGVRWRSRRRRGRERDRPKASRFRYSYEIPLAPVVGETSTPLAEHDVLAARKRNFAFERDASLNASSKFGPTQVLGVATNGVELTAGVVQRKFDNCTGHVLLASNTYHYHEAPTRAAAS